MTQRDLMLDCALDIGEQLLISGAEINRVEDSISRICRAYGASSVHVLAITACIVTTVYFEDGESLTRTRRTVGEQIDLDKLRKLNTLSRWICSEKPEIGEVQKKLAEIGRGKGYPEWLMMFFYAVAASSFCIFFGGNLMDAVNSAIVGVFLQPVVSYCGKMGMHKVFSSIISAIAGAFVIVGLLKLGIGDHFDLIVMGVIMPLIPGLSMTNAIRDLIAGDTITGMLRLSEAVLVAVALAIGFAVVGGLA